jgi:hypothetical protein
VFSEDYLRMAMRAPTARRRLRWARQGLQLGDAPLSPDTQVLLLRQLYLGHLERRELRHAARVAAEMVSVGALADLAHHDAARVMFALGERPGAVGQQRLAARAAPAERRSFHLWSLAALQHFAGDSDGALESLARGARWAGTDRALVHAHDAYIRLERGEAVPGLAGVVGALRASRAAQGYGLFLLGMIAHHTGDGRAATSHLRAFVERHVGSDPPKALTLGEELRRAQDALAYWSEV